MENFDVLVVGGGAAGYFGAITAAQARPGLRVLLVERGAQPLAKVRISGGGRCNVTHACFEARPLSARYPRGSRALLAAFSRFQPADTVEWFERRGVRLKTEGDGRMFPETNRSESVIECLEREAEGAGVEVRLRCGVENLRPSPEGGWDAELSGAGGQWVRARRVLVATGEWRDGGLAAALSGLGHQIERPVPSLFTFHVEEDWVRSLAGVSVGQACVSASEGGLVETGPVLFTHWGLSGPAILRLSAWGARELNELGYKFGVRVRWSVEKTEEQLQAVFQEMRVKHPGKAVANTPLFQIPARLWERLLVLAGVPALERWNQLQRQSAVALAGRILRTELKVVGKSMHKDEFVTCGGVSLKQVDFKTMESRVCPGLFFAGEVLDVDGITGGFNFQAAWTTGWLAGQAMALGG